MARKKIEPITSLGNFDNLTVQKSLPLFALWQSDLTLAEFKILDTYLSRINSHEPEKRAVVFGKGELEKLLGVRRITNTVLKQRLKHLMGSVVELSDKDCRKGFNLITLFEKAVAEKDEDGLWEVKMSCTQQAMKYIFNIEHLGYLRYKLRCITSLTSRYTYIMFVYLEKNRLRKSWEVSIDELKRTLACDKEESYKSFKEFNRAVLKRVYAEMTEKTECRYTYEPIKKGRSVVAVRFTLEPLRKAIVVDSEPDVVSSTDRPLWQTALDDLQLTEPQTAELYEHLVLVPDRKLPDERECYGSVDIQRYHYLQIKVKELIRRDSEKPIPHKFKYLLKMIDNDR